MDKSNKMTSSWDGTRKLLFDYINEIWRSLVIWCTKKQKGYSGQYSHHARFIKDQRNATGISQHETSY